MALDFPASPTNGQIFTGGGATWVWDGTKWVNGASATAYAPIASPVFTGNPSGPTPPPGDNDTSLATTAFVTAAMGAFVTPAYSNVGRNLIHNSMFNIAQRGSGPFTVNNSYTLDRWQLSTNLDTASISIGTMNDGDRAAIGDEVPRLSMFNTWTGNAGAAANTYMVQKIENVRRLAGKTVTVSLWAKANAGTPKLGINIANVFGTGGSPSAPVWATAVAVTTGTAWARYSATIVIPSASGMTLGTNNDSATWLSIWYSSGATNNALSGNIGVQSGVVQIWGVQLEIGTVATPLEKPDPRYDLSNCQRFYEIGSFNNSGSGANAGNGVAYFQPFMVQKRAVPSITTNGVTLTNVSSPTYTATNAGIQPAANLIASGGYIFSGGYTASADL